MLAKMKINFLGIFLSSLMIFVTIHPVNAGDFQVTKQAVSDLSAVQQAQTNTPFLNAVALSTGGYHTCVITTTGGVKCWGINDSGQLGDGTITSRSMPVDVSGLTGVIAIAAGAYHTCALITGGSVKCWGYNSRGQLGDGTTLNSNIPVSVSGLTGANAITAGDYHTCALMDNKGVKCWGNNDSGQLGDATTSNRSMPVDVSELAGVAAISAGGYHTCGLITGGSVKCWGSNYRGQLGDGTNTDRSAPVNVSGLTDASRISTGGSHTCALTNDKGIKCWGSNQLGQAGYWPSGSTNVPVELALTGVDAVTLGDNHTCILTIHGGVKCWGYNWYGQLGDGTKVSLVGSKVDVIGLTGVTVMDAGANHTCALISNGGVKCWGHNYYGQLGNGRYVWRSLPTDTNGLATGNQKIFAGYSHTCLLTANDGIKCWGNNYSGQLGNGTYNYSSLPVDVNGLASGVLSAATGGAHTCALVSSNMVKCWGHNSYGQLGNGGFGQSSTPVDVNGLSGVASITAGLFHTCARLDTGNVKCWGYNDDGQLGDGTNTGSNVPVDVSELTGVIAIAAGDYHTCAVITGGSVKCWGYNFYHQLGNGTSTTSNIPVAVGEVSNIKALAAGGNHTCALTTGGDVKCWGSKLKSGMNGGYSFTDPQDVTSNIKTIAAGTNHTCAVTTGNGVVCWGQNDSGQLGDGSIIAGPNPVNVGGLASGVMTIAAGGDYTCALTTNGRSKCWGEDEVGELGLGEKIQALLPVDVLSSNQSLAINYTTGKAGSFFTVTGWNFPPNTMATITANGYTLTTTVPVSATGNFTFILGTSAGDAGYFNLTASVNPSASTRFYVLPTAPLRVQEGGGVALAVPAGLGIPVTFAYLPSVVR